MSYLTSHELAKKLLDLPDRELVGVKALEKGYTAEFQLGDPWEDPWKRIRVMLKQKEDDCEPRHS